MKTLLINSSNGYLNLSDLPYNCIFNKVVTGCGGTTIVLFNNENYVIAVPTTELITNKTGLSEAGVATITNYDGKEQTVFGLFGVFSYSVKKELKKYAEGKGTKKIMCTYDKIGKLAEYLEPTDYRLLVDEYHILLKAYSYRSKAIDGVLSTFRSYKSFCFMSATPIQADFKPSCLADVEEIEAVWDETDTMIVKLDLTNKPYIKAANYINAYKKDGFIEINGNRSYEAFFFINSVTDIASILQYCDLSNEEVKIVCADNESNRAKLAGYTITNSRSENKPFTFITSKSFEGADYFSDSALCFVVSNSTNTNTLLDISTDIYQIAGRIRTESNPFRNLLVHIFNTTGNRNIELDITYEDMIKRTNDNIEGANEIISAINNSSDKAKEMAKKMLNSQYVMQDKEGNYFVNDMLVKLDLFTFRLEQSIYKDGIALRSAYNKNDMLTTDITVEKITDSMKKAGKKMSFKDAFLRYAELISKMVITTETNTLAKIQPLIVNAYHRLGVDKVRSLRYSKSAVEAALINWESDKNKDTKVAQILGKRIKTGFYSSADIKGWISEAYNTVGIIDKVKATDLTNWFDCEASTKRIDSKVTKGFIVYRPKIVFR